LAQGLALKPKVSLMLTLELTLTMAPGPSQAMPRRWPQALHRLIGGESLSGPVAPSRLWSELWLPRR
jgi:hypothetical protein